MGWAYCCYFAKGTPARASVPAAVSLFLVRRSHSSDVAARGERVTQAHRSHLYQRLANGALGTRE